MDYKENALAKQIFNYYRTRLYRENLRFMQETLHKLNAAFTFHHGINKVLKYRMPTANAGHF